MRKLLYTLFIFYSIVAPQIMGQSVGRSNLLRDGGSPKVFGKVTLPLGHVFVQSTKESNWLKAGFNREVFQNEKVKTESKSRCEVKLDEKKVLRIGEQTMVTFLESKNASIHIEFGQAWLTDLSQKRKATNIRMPTAVAAIRGTVFRIDCNNNHSTINVYAGTVDVSPLKDDGLTPEDTTFSVEAGEKLVVTKNLEEYIEKQNKALQKFKDKEESDFDAFRKKEIEDYKAHLMAERAQFKQFKSYNVHKSKIGTENPQSSEWINWNKERDLLNK